MRHCLRLRRHKGGQLEEGWHIAAHLDAVSGVWDWRPGWPRLLALTACQTWLQACRDAGCRAGLCALPWLAAVREAWQPWPRCPTPICRNETPASFPMPATCPGRGHLLRLG